MVNIYEYIKVWDNHYMISNGELRRTMVAVIEPVIILNN